MAMASEQLLEAAAAALLERELAPVPACIVTEEMKELLRPKMKERAELCLEVYGEKSRLTGSDLRDLHCLPCRQGASKAGGQGVVRGNCAGLQP